MIDIEGYPCSAVGVSWYSPEQWKLLAAMPEAKIEKSYQDFVRTYERNVRDYAARGAQVVRIDIDVAKMTEWCHKNGYEIDAKGRATYGSMLLLARDDPSLMDKPPIDRTRSVQ